MQNIRYSKATSVAFFFAGMVRFGLSCIVIALLAVPVLAEQWRVKVTDVLDGDTVVLASGDRLRLRGIDAPEVRHGDTPGQYYGRESGDTLKTLVHEKDLFLDKEELDRDRYGRLVGTPRMMDGRIVALVMVEEGAAFVYPHPSDKDGALAERLRAAQIGAMNRGEGFWPFILNMPAATKTYLGTVSSRRFHAMGCANGRKVKKNNQTIFSSLREAFAAGYAPARECTPWPKR